MILEQRGDLRVKVVIDRATCTATVEDNIGGCWQVKDVRFEYILKPEEQEVHVVMFGQCDELIEKVAVGS